MSCRLCGSETQTEFASEISVHVLGLENVNEPTVMVFPKCIVLPTQGLSCRAQRISAQQTASNPRTN
jgi:hypothetical protein